MENKNDTVSQITINEIIDNLKDIIATFKPIAVGTELAMKWFIGKSISENELFINGNKTELKKLISSNLKCSIRSIEREIAFYKAYPNIEKENDIDLDYLYKEFNTTNLTWTKIIKRILPEELKSPEIKELPKPETIPTEIPTLCRDIPEIKISKNQLIEQVTNLKPTAVLFVDSTGKVLNRYVIEKQAQNDECQIIEAFYGLDKIKNASPIEWNNAKNLSKAFPMTAILITIEKLKRYRKTSSEFYIKNCTSIQWLYKNYSAIVNGMNDKKDISQDAHEKFLLEHPEFA